MRNTIIIPEIRELLNKNDIEPIKSFCTDLHPVEVAELLSGLSIHELQRIFAILDPRKASEIFKFFSVERQVETITEGDRKEIAKIIEEMNPDDRADLVKELTEDVVEVLLPLIANAEREDIRKLVTYKEGTTGSVMTTDYASVEAELTCAEALQKLKAVAPASETIYYIYITNGNRQLIGLLSLKDLILSRSYARISEIMHKDVVSVNLDDDVEKVAAMIAKYDFLAIPVIDQDKRLVGIVTVDDVVDVLNEEATEDIYHMGAAGSPLDYKTASIFNLARQRIVWLLVLVAAGFISGMVMEQFADVLHSVVALTFFLPLLCDSGGNAGCQTSTVIIRGMATGELNTQDLWSIIKKEFLIGILVGLLLGILAAGRALLLNQDPTLGMIVGFSMLFTIIIAKTAGAILPILFKRIGLDPALMSGPLITSLIDIFSILLYLKLAWWFLI